MRCCHQYCDQGRCELLEWEWVDFGPMSMSGLGEMQVKGSRYTTAVTETYTIEIQAYGVEDNLICRLCWSREDPIHTWRDSSKGPYFSPYGSDWFDVGRVVIHKKGALRAQSDAELSDSKAKRPYVLYTPHRITDLRVRMVEPATMHRHGTATGMGDKDACYANAGDHDGREPCYRKTPGSMATLGYRVGIAETRSLPGCTRTEATRRWPAIVIGAITGSMGCRPGHIEAIYTVGTRR